MKRDPWGMWFLPDAALLIIPLGAALVATLGGHGDWFAPPKAARDGGWIFNYQTLISGGLAIVAAAIGALFIWLQIRTSERQEANRLARRFAAARAELQMTLNGIVRFTEGTGRELKRLLDMTATGAPVPTGTAVSFPALSEQVVPHLRDMIETGDDDTTEVLSGLIGALQVLQARVESLVEKVNDPSNRPVRAELLQRVLDNADVDAHATAMFPFSRRKGDRLPERRFDENEIHAAVRRTLSFYGDIADLDRIVEIRAGRYRAGADGSASGQSAK